MTRLPFDPEKMAGPAAPPPPPARRMITVSELASLIDGALRTAMPARVHVVGEVSGFRDRSHWYFDLKDEGAVVNCVMFASGAARAQVRPENGRKVVVTGRVEFYAKQGKTQVYAEAIEPLGDGELEARLRALVAELKALGWMDPERKRPLPVFPHRVAVVTSRTGAALQDVLDTMRRRCPAVGVALVDVRVQGELAAAEVARAIDWLSEHHERLSVDAIVVTRGGGSMEDLWAFNERVVAQAIVRCAVPVVAAIGHETDTTIAELVADERAATPTQAAMRITPDRLALSEQGEHLARRLRGAVDRLIVHERQRLRGASRHPVLADPKRMVVKASDGLAGADRAVREAAHRRLSTARLRLERAWSRLARQRPEAVYAARCGIIAEAIGRLRRAVWTRLGQADIGDLGVRLERAWGVAAERRANHIASLGRELEVVAPRRVLARGFSLTMSGSGTLVRSPSDVRVGEQITTLLADGRLESVVSRDGTPAEAPAGSGPARPLPPRPDLRRSRSARRKPPDPSQMDLFGPGR